MKSAPDDAWPRVELAAIGACTVFVVALGSGAAWFVASQNCNTSPSGDEGAGWSFSSFCRDMRFYHYSAAHPNDNPVLAVPQAIFALPVLLIVVAVTRSLRAGRFRPQRTGTVLAVGLLAGLLALSFTLASTTFRGAA